MFCVYQRCLVYFNPQYQYEYDDVVCIWRIHKILIDDNQLYARINMALHGLLECRGNVQ